jgi:hypothetical protein
MSRKYNNDFCVLFDIDPTVKHDDDFIIDIVLNTGNLGKLNWRFPPRIMNYINITTNRTKQKISYSNVINFIEKCTLEPSVCEKYVCMKKPSNITVSSVEINV